MTRAAGGHVVHPGGLFLFSIMAAAAGISPVAIRTLLPKHLHVVVVVKGNHGTLLTGGLVSVGRRGLDLGMRDTHDIGSVRYGRHASTI